MHIGYRTGLTLTSLILALIALTASTPPPAQPICASSLYSRRALQRVRTLMQFRLLELRKARLGRLEHAVERNLPLDKLIEPHRSPAPKPTARE